jgi:hypothetical protein
MLTRDALWAFPVLDLLYPVYNNFLQIIFFVVLTWSSEEAMGSCCSCPDKDTVPDNHRNKFKVSKTSRTINVSPAYLDILLRH